MKIADIADESYRELGSPSDISTASIIFWMLNNIGLLNTLLSTEFTVAGNEVSPELELEESIIIKLIYRLTYLEKKIRSNLGAGAYAPVVSISSEGVRMTRINKTSIAQSYMKTLEETEAALSQLVSAYKSDKTKIAQIATYVY